MVLQPVPCPRTVSRCVTPPPPLLGASPPRRAPAARSSVLGLAAGSTAGDSPRRDSRGQRAPASTAGGTRDPTGTALRRGGRAPRVVGGGVPSVPPLPGHAAEPKFLQPAQDKQPDGTDTAAAAAFNCLIPDFGLEHPGNESWALPGHWGWGWVIAWVNRLQRPGGTRVCGAAHACVSAQIQACKALQGGGCEGGAAPACARAEARALVYARGFAPPRWAQGGFGASVWVPRPWAVPPRGPPPPRVPCQPGTCLGPDPEGWGHRGWPPGMGGGGQIPPRRGFLRCGDPGEVVTPGWGRGRRRGHEVAPQISVSASAGTSPRFLPLVTRTRPWVLPTPTQIWDGQTDRWTDGQWGTALASPR